MIGHLASARTVERSRTLRNESLVGKSKLSLRCSFEFGNDDNPGRAAGPDSFEQYRRGSFPTPSPDWGFSMTQPPSGSF